MEAFADIFQMFKVIGQGFIWFWWIVLPVAFFYIFKEIWFDYVHAYSKWSYLSKLDYMLLEVIPPREIEKSPKLMEPIFWAMAGVLTTYNTFDVWIEGKITPRFMLEMVGKEGEVHFYIRTERSYRNLIEAQIYAQYPEAQVKEVEDYVKDFPKVVPNKEWDLWGSDMEFLMPDIYPIKTYEKFEEDITGRMIDPVGGLAEVMGTLGPGQHIWMQFVIEPLHEGAQWRQDGANEIKKLAGRAVAEKKGVLGDLKDVLTHVHKGLVGPIEFPGAPKPNEQPLEFRLTPGEKELLKAVEANLGLNHFKTKLRIIYIGRRGPNFSRSYVSSFMGAFKQFNDLNLNNFRPQDRSKTYANFVFRKSRADFRKRMIYRRYKSRNMDGVKITFSLRELATLFHFPDMDVKTPAVPRIDSRKGTAPANLPIQ
jgi:hypothetical protein